MSAQTKGLPLVGTDGLRGLDFQLDLVGLQKQGSDDAAASTLR